MRVLLLVALFSLLVQLSSEEIIGYENDDQELLIYKSRVITVEKLLRSECSNYIKKRETEFKPATLAHLDVEKQIYNVLIKMLVECRARKARKTQKPTTVTTTKPTTVTTTKPSTVTTTKPTTTAAPKYRDCQEFYEHGYRKSGVYETYLPNLPPFDVWCDFFGNHGWTVIQRRENDGTVSFDRKWAAYKQGFGDVDGEQWLGNDKIHPLTTTNQKLNIQLVLKDGSQKSGYWTKFYISDESDNYRLTIDGSGYTGDLVDQFSNKDTDGEHNGMAFSTADRDNDRNSGNCAANYKDGWWYNNCYYVALNSGNHGGMNWNGYGSQLRSSVMRVTR